jgi:hypothetical protein
MALFKALCFSLFFLPVVSLANDIGLHGDKGTEFIHVELGSSKDRSDSEFSKIWKGFDVRHSGSLEVLRNEPCVWSIKYKRGKFLPKYGVHQKSIEKQTFSCDLSGSSPIAGSTYSRKSGKRFFCMAGCEKNPFKILHFEI